MDPNLISYYRDRANEYEQIYSKPERQNDLKRIGSILHEEFFGKTVLEIACGTGYWTELFSMR
jgi:ubiquinone/menaquinone biosynthesis C-methylase UbiE